jgi:hypothetical protein
MTEKVGRTAGICRRMVQLNCGDVLSDTDCGVGVLYIGEQQPGPGYYTL